MIFFDKARVAKYNGCYFYDQDIITNNYLYSGDCRIKLQLNYVNSGFGILLIQDAEDIFKSPLQYMFKLGDNEYSFIEKKDNVQDMQEYSTVQFKHLINDENTFLVLEKNNNKIDFYLENEDNQILFAQNFNVSIKDYKIGFYSQYGNTIKSVQISTGLPVGWAANSISTVGGRLYYYDNTIQFENCTYDAETETDYIELKAGTYYLKANIVGDIKAHVFESLSEDTDKIEKELLDGNKFILENDAKVSVLFSGKNGTVSNISLQEYENSEYIPSSGNGAIYDGSYLHFDLENIQKFSLDIVINSLPIADKLHYYYVKYDDREFVPELPLNQTLHFEFDRDDLTISYPNGYIHLNEYTSRYLDMFYNIDALISSLIITNKKGEVQDVLHLGESITHLDNYIKAPILCLDDKDNPFDLSSSYREIIIPSTTIEMFNKYSPINLSKKIDAYTYENIQVVGIKEFTEINPNGKTIDEFIKSDVGYDYLNFNHLLDVDLENNVIHIDKATKEKYKYIIISYPHAENFMYRFTNWSREYFNNSKLNLKLAKPILDTFNNIYVYGTNNEVNEDYFYRVRVDRENIDVKMAADKTDLIDNSEYDIDFVRNEIQLKDLNYKYYIVEYLKEDSYAINDLKYNKLINKPTSNLYEIKIATNKELINILYDNSITSYKITNINLTPNEYVVAR